MDFDDFINGGLFLVMGGIVLKGIYDIDKDQKDARKKETERKNTPCLFLDGISKNDFEQIVYECASDSKYRIEEISIKGPVVKVKVHSIKRLSKWTFKIDYNDYGHITGKYWLSSEDENSKIPIELAESIKKYIEHFLHSSNKTRHIFPDWFNEKIAEKSKKYRVRYCPYCGDELINKNANFCRNCGGRLMF